VAVRLEDSNGGTNLNDSILLEIKVRLLRLTEDLLIYFPDIAKKIFRFVKSFFIFGFGKIPKMAQEEMIEMVNDAGIKSSSSSFWETQFLFSKAFELSRIRKKSLKMFISFSVTCECEVRFSSLLLIKTKHKSRLNVEDDLRCAVPSTGPRIEKLGAEM
jgi:hypothetical protein